jgi:hypothetical protein
VRQGRFAFNFKFSGGPMPPKQFAAQRIPDGAVVLLALNESVYSAIIEKDIKELKGLMEILGRDIVGVVKNLANEEVRRIMNKPSPKKGKQDDKGNSG